jgi:hypothetical protein
VASGRYEGSKRWPSVTREKAQELHQIMRSNTKLFRALRTMQAQFRKKSQRFEKNFVASTFFLFFGFMCGNLFGTFLSFFRNTIPWDGAIIAVILLFVEWVNYLNFVVLNKRTPLPSSPESKKPFVVLCFIQIGLIIPRCLDYFRAFMLQTKKAEFQNQWSRFLKSAFVFFQRKRNTAIRLLNFYKLGLLLGFFIDAFKVGS